MSKTVFVKAVIAMSMLFSVSLMAEQKKTLGQWDVHYSAFSSTLLAPAVATQYDLTRSASKGVLNIAVLDKQTQKAQTPGVAGQVVNPLGQIQELEFQQVTEGDASYYLAQFNYTNAETLRFTIEVGDQQTLKFNQEFWLND
ncbi:DUF4426 domain-containing protein [Idiomarina abyssalis]|uniref:DUF4426 domain-containing protein n=1 Tax=Idiomarina abyssalis TaxID=86102 RepID=A0A8I1GDR4_9GAMM|nr:MULTISPECIES: DUF4426 domain-containing protein [Idiomarina]RDX34929.1 DUF4426 domain-containing protein [Idiomarina sp. HD9-110m-PIT-SAG05]MAB21226.1 hypothetical protein [Idiomarina sp.]MBE91845.1 hypothetical protein [Idiomarina sp.]MBH93936.1 hypothetical protein [Idiomarina sp.]MBJ7267884.1 DUF4426 domain-containing protein [Idiomarina abyssalis]